MSWRFRKAFKLFPGAKLNLSKSGLSVSLGGAPATLNFGHQGPVATFGAPGTGLSVRVPVGGTASRPGAHPVEPETDPLSRPPESGASREIRSVRPELLQGGKLDGYRQLLEEAQIEEAALRGEITNLEPIATHSVHRSGRWSGGWLFRRIMPKKLERIRAQAEEDVARLNELREQLACCRVNTEIDVPAQVAEVYEQLRVAFIAMAGSDAVWDNVAQRTTDQRVERTSASSTVERHRVKFEMTNCSVIAFDAPVPCLRNHNGGHLFFYPGFVFVRDHRGAIAVLDASEVSLAGRQLGFIECEKVPSDAEVIEHTWFKTNKDGSPDRRFRDNYEIPVVRYGCLTVESDRGLSDEWMVSNVDATLSFVAAWERMTNTLASLD